MAVFRVMGLNTLALINKSFHAAVNEFLDAGDLACWILATNQVICCFLGIHLVIFSRAQKV